MKAGGGKQKGGSFERLICKMLSLWLSRGIHDDYFWRSAMSGGRASVKFKRGQRNQTQEGDISAIDPQGNRLTDHFVIECKCVKDLHIQWLIDARGTGGLLEYWDTLKGIAQRNNKRPMLIGKENLGLIWVVLNTSGVERLGLRYHASAHFPGHDIFLVPFTSFHNHARRP